MNPRLLLASALLFITASRDISAAEPFLEKSDLFVSDTMGYKLHHIPGIVVTAKGTVLAWCEARKNTGHDWDAIDILLRRSTDQGKTWSEAKKLTELPGPKEERKEIAAKLKFAKPNDVTYNNPVLIADRDGTVHMTFCLNYTRCFYQRSTDDGLTWIAPVEITATFEDFRKAFDWKVLATGPNHSIQLKNGRLIVPVWLSTATGAGGHHPSVAATIYSDDRGKTWHAGEIAVPRTEEWIDPGEAVAIELADGRVMLNVRNESKAQRRLITVSRDGATGWSVPKFDDALREPICMAAIARYSIQTNGGKNRILFSNPDTLSYVATGNEVPGKSNHDRKNLSVKLSYDEGRNWAINKVLDPGYSGYSDLAVTQDGTILCLYGRGEKNDFHPGFAFRQLTLARFNLEWLSDGKDSPKP